MRALACLAVTACLMALAGCGCGGDAESIVGEWKWDDPKSDADVGMRFDPDGRYKSWFQGSVVNVTDEGTYTIEGASLVLNQTRHVSTNGKLDTTPKTESLTIRWVSPNEFEMIDASGMAIVYVRSTPD